MTHPEGDWRTLEGEWTAWFDAPSLTAAASLAGRVVQLSADHLVDLRPSGVQVRLTSPEHADAVSAAARDLGLVPDPSGLQRLGVVVESTAPSAVTPFWQGVLDYALAPDGGLADRYRRDPAVRVRWSSQDRPLRNRLHLDVVRPAAVAALASPGEASGPYGVRHADADGNEVDLVPGDPLGETPATSDWQTVFATMACYRVTTSIEQRDLAIAAAALADDAGFPLLVDLRPGLVVLDTGKDRADPDAHGLALDFADLAADLQRVARGVGAVVDPSLPRFVQLFLDAADVAAVRAFWIAALGYVEDAREGLTDIHDPRRLGPVLVLQELDAADTARRQQRNRVHVEITVPREAAGRRVATAVAAGGSILEESASRWRVSDPEGNDLVVVAGG